MDNLSSLLVMLQQNGLNKTYDNAVKSISSLRDTLISAKDEVNDEVMRLILEDKHLEIGKLGPIPSMCLEIADKLNVLLNVENKGISFSESNIENKVEEKVEEKIEKPFGEVVNVSKNVEEEEIYEYNSIVTTIKGIKVGAKLLHKAFGVGEVLSLEDNEKSNTKLLSIKFADEEKPKKFTCSEEILSKYFGIETVEKSIENKGNYIEKGYNLYTSMDYFTFKKPYKIKIFGEETDVKNWGQAAQVLFRYLYNRDTVAFLNVREVKGKRGFSNKKYELRRPIEITNDLYFEGNKSASDCLKTMSSISEQFLDVLVKDVRKNVELFIRE